MRCGFRPHNRDRMNESMEGVWIGYWATLKGCWAANKRGFYGSPVNRWSIKRPPNGTKLDRWSPGGILRPLDKPQSIPRMFDTRTRKKTRGVHRRR